MKGVMPPLWWIWVTTFLTVGVRGEAYYAIERGDWRMARFVAGVVTDTCRRIRAGAGRQQEDR